MTIRNITGHKISITKSKRGHYTVTVRAVGTWCRRKTSIAKRSTTMKQKCEMLFEPREGWKSILIDELLRLGCNMTKSQINSLIDYAMLGIEPKADFSDVKMSGALNHDAWLDRVAFFAGSVAECPIFDDDNDHLDSGGSGTF